jgi:WD40 repeat protein
MKPLKPTGRIDLEHRAEYLRGRPDGSVIVAASANGYVSIVHLHKEETHPHRPSGKVKAISPHPAEPLFALVDGVSGSLLIQSNDGVKISQVQPPPIQDNASKSLTSGFSDCYFDEGGDGLWLAAPLGDDECQLSLVETQGWSVTRSAVVEDHFGQSSFSFHPTGQVGLISLWVAAGQDGQEVYLLKREGSGFSINRVQELTNCIPPAFSQDGTELLTVTEDFSIRRYAFPSMKNIGPPCFSGDEDNPFAESLCYLEGQHALAGTGEQRLFLVDTATMQIEEEIAIEGHEPRPIWEYYPTLAKERGLGTDISWFSRVGQVIVFVFRRDRGTELQGWKDSLLWYSVKR